jgi:hypothetical protein
MCHGAHLCPRQPLYGPNCADLSHVHGLTLSYTASYILAEGVQLEPQTDLDDDTATLAWLVGALEQARSQGQTRIVDHLETIADDVVFEMEMIARRASLLSRVI